MTCDQCHELRLRIRELERDLYGDPGDHIIQSIEWVAGFTGQQNEILSLLYRSARPLSTEEINERLPRKYAGYRDRKGMVVQICIMRRRRPGIIESRRKDFGMGYYELSPAWREMISDRIAYLKERLNHGASSRYTRRTDDEVAAQATEN